MKTVNGGKRTKSASNTPSAPLPHALSRNLIFVSGKGGVGKTAVSMGIARALARDSKKKILWVTFENPLLPPGELEPLEPNLFRLNCEASIAFEEYIRIKVGSALSRLLVHNKLVRYLSKAAPGIHELVLLGKVWFERSHYDHVVCDMPSTGYGLAMFQSTANFAQLFRGGPLSKDADAMLETFRDSDSCSQVIVSLAEEMPLQESIELRDFLLQHFPENEPVLLANRLLPNSPELGVDAIDPDPDHWESPVAESATDYARKRVLLERENLGLWDRQQLDYGSLPFIPPLPGPETLDHVARALADAVTERGWIVIPNPAGRTGGRR